MFTLGDGIAVGTLLVVVGGLIFKAMPNKSVSEISLDLCNAKHKSVDDKFERAETDRQEMLAFLKRIEDKLDGHIKLNGGSHK